MNQNSESAFPRPGFPGLTLRDYFAAASLAALDGRTERWEDIANRAYAIADAMMKKRGE